MTKPSREQVLFALTFLWAVDHLWGWFVFNKYGIGISPVAILIVLASLIGMIQPRSSIPVHNALLVLFFVVALGPSQSTETVAFLLTILLSRITLGSPRPWGGAFIASGIYLFAGLNKLVSDEWRDGRIYSLGFAENLGLEWVVIYGTVGVEIGLALLLFLRLRVALVAIVVFHIAIALLVSSDIHHVYSLLVYGGIMFYLAFGSCRVTLRNLLTFIRGRA